MYSLYILAINKIESGCFIHFSAVPYETLTVSSMMNLYYNNLVIEDINILKGCGVHLKTKKYQCASCWLNSFSPRCVKETLANQDNISDNIKRGYIYIYIF